MRSPLLLLLLAACTAEVPQEAPAAAETNVEMAPVPTRPSSAEPPPASPARAAGWRLTRGEGGTALDHHDGAGARVATLFCAGDGQLIVNIPSFKPVASEERMSIGAGGIVTALVADTAGDAARGGVSGEGPVPSELPAMLTAGEPIRVNYGYQDLGGLAPVPEAEARSFLAACSG